MNVPRPAQGCDGDDRNDALNRRVEQLGVNVDVEEREKHPEDADDICNFS